MSLWVEPNVVTNTGACDVMAGSTISMKRVLVDLLTPIIPMIVRETTREVLINFHYILILNRASAASRLGGGQHRHLVLSISTEDYLTQTAQSLVPSHNTVIYPPTLETMQ